MSMFDPYFIDVRSEKRPLLAAKQTLLYPIIKIPKQKKKKKVYGTKTFI